MVWGEPVTGQWDTGTWHAWTTADSTYRVHRIEPTFRDDGAASCYFAVSRARTLRQVAASSEGPSVLWDVATRDKHGQARRHRSLLDALEAALADYCERTGRTDVESNIGQIVADAAKAGLAAAREVPTKSVAVAVEPAALTEPKPPPPPLPDGKKMSALEAAARVLREAGQSMTCPEMVAAMAQKGYWASPNGKTPAATLSASIGVEIKKKKDAARFRREGNCKFTLS